MSSDGGSISAPSSISSIEHYCLGSSFSFLIPQIYVCTNFVRRLTFRNKFMKPCASIENALTRVLFIWFPAHSLTQAPISNLKYSAFQTFCLLFRVDPNVSKRVDNVVTKIRLLIISCRFTGRKFEKGLRIY